MLLAVVFLFGGSLSKENQKTQSIPISELAVLINSGAIQNITVKENIITSIGSDNAKFITKNGLNESFFDVLKYYNLDAEKLANVEINFIEKVDWGNII